MYFEFVFYFLFLVMMLRGLYLAGYTSCMLMTWRFFAVFSALQIQPSLSILLTLLFELPHGISQNCAFFTAYFILELYQRSQIVHLATAYRFQNLGIINNLIGVVAYLTQGLLILGILMCYFERTFELYTYREFDWFYENSITQAMMKMVRFVFPRFDFTPD